MSRRENRNRTPSTRWPSLPQQEDTFDDLDNSFTIDPETVIRALPTANGAIIDPSGRLVAFNAAAFDSRSSDSDEGNRLIVGLRHASSPGITFGERDWSRPTRKHVYDQPSAGSTLDWPSAHRRHHPQDHDHERLPRTRIKPGRRPAGESRPVLERGESHRGTSVPADRHDPADSGRRRGRYASSGTQTMPGAKTSPSATGATEGQTAKITDQSRRPDPTQQGAPAPVPGSSTAQGSSTPGGGAPTLSPPTGGGPRPSPEDSQKPHISEESRPIEQHIILPKPQMPPTTQLAPTPQPNIPTTLPPSGPQVSGIPDPKPAPQATTMPAPMVNPDVPPPIPKTSPASANPVVPTVPARAGPLLASLYMLTTAGQDNHLQSPQSGISIGSVPADHVVFTKKDGESHDFLAQSGPMLFEAAPNPMAAGDQDFELAINDRLREDFAYTWKPPAEKGTRQDTPSFLQGFAVTVQSQADKSFEITNLKMKVAKDASSPALIFSTSANVLNEEFEAGYESVAPTSTKAIVEPPVTAAAATPAVSPVTTLSGIRRYPGRLIFGLEHSTADGGFKTLGDLCVLADLSPKPWLKALLKASKITFGSLAGTPARNAIWLVLGSSSQCCVRLEAKVDVNDGIAKQLDKYIAGWKNDLPYISAIARRVVIPSSGPWGGASVGGELVIAVEPKSVDGVPHGLSAYVSFGDDEIRFMLVCYSAKLQWSFIKKWLLASCTEVEKAIGKLEETLGSVGKSPTSSENASKPTQPDSLDHILWRKVTVTLGPDSTGKNTTLVGLTLELEANFQVLVPDGKSAVFTMEFSWNKTSGEFSGECAFKGSGPSFGQGQPPLQYRWDYERWNTLSYLVPSEPYMSLRHLSSSISEHLPFGVPTEIVLADLFVSNKKMRFRGEMQALLGRSVASTSSSPPLKIDYAMMDVAVNIDYAEKPTKVSAEVTGAVGLLPYRRGDPDATLRATITYASENDLVSFQGMATNIPMTVLHTLFPEGEEREHAMSILEHITIREIGLLIKHTKGSETTIEFNGAIEISGFLLKTNFDRKGAESWSLDSHLLKQEANVGASPKEIDLGEAIEKLLGPSVAELIPDFVTKTKLKVNDPANDGFDVECLRLKDPNCLVFGAELKFGLLHVQFAQIVPVATKPSAGAKPAVKRLIRVSVGPLPSVPKLPVVGDLPIPFDALEFLWVSDTMTQSELDILNVHIKKFQTQNISLGKGNTELVKGSHFRLVGSGSVFLDHIFDDTKPQKAEKDAADVKSKESPGAPTSTSKLPVQAASGSSAKDVTPAAASGGNSAATTAPLENKKKGPLTLSGVALSYEGGKLRIHLDASVLIGPIGAGVQGLNLIMDVSKVNGLHNLLHMPMDVQIEGFDMSFKRSPVLLAGALYHKPKTQAFYGGIAISLSKLSVAALGMYSQMDAVANPPAPAYDSFFVYGMVEGLIFTVGWAEIRGLILGFGYNSRLRLPTVDQITSFPLMQGFSNPGGFNMDDAIKSLTGPGAYMTPSRGSLWMALGLVIRACEVIDMKAVATVALGPDQAEIGLIARATATLPRGSSSDSALILIDLSVIGRLDLIHGELSVDGLINPTSFILSKDCRPSGGFSIRSWFSNSPHEGDWVVSFGGYHPLYQVPAHYPRPPRLGISWNLGSNIRVTGNAYAAVTPGALMAGGLLQAVFSAGPFGAHFDAHADFLVNLKPLHYEADMAVFAGVYFEIRVWFIRKKISVDIGASLHLEGPPIHGQVHFDLCVVSFSVSFGSGRKESPKPIELAALMDLVLQPAAGNRIGDTINNAHTFTVVSGLLSDGAKKDTAKKNSPEKESWVVRSDNFLFQVRSAVPVTNAEVDLADSSGPSYSGQKIISRPMQMTNDHNGIHSSMNVKVRRVDTGEILPFRVVATIEDKLPANYWGRYSKNPGDYMRPDPVTMPSSINHLVGMTLVPPMPKRSEKSMPVFKSVADPFVGGTWKPEAISKKNTRFVDDDDARDSVKWSRLRGAMSKEATGKQKKLSREAIMDCFLDVAHPSTDAQTNRVKTAYKRIGASVPRVVLDDPARFYVSPPTVFCN
ncbi:hypothetical protein V8C35DRAFT_116546 [Trichoderma chlorosporum]